MRVKATSCPDGVGEGNTVLTGSDLALVRWALDQVEKQLDVVGDRLSVLWSVVFTASVMADSDAVLGAVVRALLAADADRRRASIADARVPTATARRAGRDRATVPTRAEGTGQAETPTDTTPLDVSGSGVAGSGRPR